MVTAPIGSEWRLTNAAVSACAPGDTARGEVPEFVVVARMERRRADVTDAAVKVLMVVQAHKAR
jgi:hypothetical protein